MASEAASRLRVHGLVQGVGYRYATVLAARKLGITGWVRNRTDGTVEIHAEGEPAALAALLDWAGKGPAHARVERVDAAEAAFEHHDSFEEIATL
ncbi:Acylphosphatase [Andreprevotia sp. IGB-42]|uniref:acylphosphatase n=1 Tax=Andreprevotia sp. IGB-42 TaxID=2497473 RepID=UPI00135B9771|nr:acylphosphatase [Andreprevotia sp. IGB-42]KAF0814242.1 Acylphosphatase [Andreprevotia sp. IGB-42]